MRPLRRRGRLKRSRPPLSGNPFLAHRGLEPSHVRQFGWNAARSQVRLYSTAIGRGSDLRHADCVLDFDMVARSATLSRTDCSHLWGSNSSGHYRTAFSSDSPEVTRKMGRHSDVWGAYRRLRLPWRHNFLRRPRQLSALVWNKAEIRIEQPQRSQESKVSVRNLHCCRSILSNGLGRFRCE
jgi:hypothetical protein